MSSTVRSVRAEIAEGIHFECGTDAHETRNLPDGPRECIVPAWWRW